jgi:hypothetical protein
VPNVLFRTSEGAFWDIFFQRFDEKCDQALSRQCMDLIGMIETMFAELQFHYDLVEMQIERRIFMTPSS